MNKNDLRKKKGRREGGREVEKGALIDRTMHQNALIHSKMQ
jgi:hypothetical protein